MRILMITLCLTAAGAGVFGFSRGPGPSDAPAPRAVLEMSQEEPLTLIGTPPALRTHVPEAQEEPEEPESDPAEEGIGEPTERASSDLPPDPVQAGPCRLALTLVDDTQSAAPVETEIALWRLGAPGNVDWTHGDQLQQTDRTDSDGRLLLEGLPEGRYRLFVRGLRDGAEDPAELTLRAEETVARVVLAMPRTFNVRLRLVDEHGRWVQQARLIFGGIRTRSQVMRAPDWRIARTPREWSLAAWIGASGGVTGCGSDMTRPLQSEEGLFNLGSHREAARQSNCTRSCSLDAPARSRASVEVVCPEPGPEGDRIYLSVFAPLDLLASRVLLPDGRRALDAGARLYAGCESVRLLPDTPSDAWRTVPITVNVSVDGYHSLAYVTDLAGPMPRWTMKGEAEEPCGTLLERRGEEALEAAPEAR